MKLNYFQLEAHLKKKLSPVYFISGEEIVLKREAAYLIRKAAKLAGFEEHTRLSPETGFDWGELYTLFYSSSLLAEKRLLELDLSHAAPNKMGAKLLQDYAENPLPHNLLLIEMGKLDEKITKSAWYKALEKISILITLWPISREQLPAWIITQARKYKLQIQDQAADLLADYVEGNLLAAQQTLEKIYLLRPSKPVDIDLINTVLTDESRFNIFEFIENLIAGRVSRALHILDNLRNEGIEPVLILWGIARELRLLAEMIAQYQKGMTSETLFQKYRIYAKRQNAIRHFISKRSGKDCLEYLLQAAELDKLAKGAMPGDIWNALQLFCLRMV